MASMTDTLATANQDTQAATGSAPSSSLGATGASSLQTTNVTDAPKPQSVTDIYSNITAQDSPLMQQAAAQANRQAARAGLMNSSMAVGSARAAQAEAAMPLAQQEANQQTSMYQFDRGQTETERAARAGEGLQQQQITNQDTQFGRSQTEAERAARAGEGFKQTELGQSQQQITNQATQFGQSLEEQKRASQVSEQQGQQQINNQASQFTQSLSQQQKESAQQNQQFQQNLDLQNRQLREQSEQFAKSIQANVRGSYTDAAQNILNNSSVNINNIASNASLKQQDKDKLIQQELNNRNNDLAQLQSMYSGVQGWADRL